MDTTESSAPNAHPSTRKPTIRKARTNLGRYRSLERRYFGGRLTLEEERLLEELVCALRGLYKAAYR
jgi:hypothetical protein